MFDLFIPAAIYAKVYFQSSVSPSYESYSLFSLIGQSSSTFLIERNNKALRLWLSFKRFLKDGRSKNFTHKRNGKREKFPCARKFTIATQKNFILKICSHCTASKHCYLPTKVGVYLITWNTARYPRSNISIFQFYIADLFAYKENVDDLVKLWDGEQETIFSSKHN